MAFLIWSIVSVMFVIIGIFTMRMKKPAGFFANVKAPSQVSDLKAYNRAVGRLEIAYAVILLASGLPLLKEKPGALIIITMLGTVFATLFILIAYTVFIGPKYIEKD